jgi:uncharacterized protein DUF3515
MPDGTTRRAARLAALAALPFALLAGVLAYWRLGGFAAPQPAPAPPATSAPAAAAASGPVAVPAPALPPRQALVCRAVLARAPDGLGALARRPVTAGPQQNAAYGDPPVTLACGSAAPSVAPEATVYALSGVCWYAEPRPGTTVWTTVDREVPVSVTVPASYPAPGQLVIAFSAAVAAAQPALAGAPSGCRAG